MNLSNEYITENPSEDSIKKYQSQPKDHCMQYLLK